VREYEFLAPTSVTLLTERRRHRAWGVEDGEAGQAGENRYNEKIVAGKVSLQVEAGDRIRVSTPGGGGWGKP
jgi:N-methylhydantoinase B